MRTYVRLGLLLAVAGVVLVSSAETGASPGITERVSVSSAGVQGTSDSGAWGRPAISADSRFVAFESFSNNLVSGDTNNASDIFLRDRVMGTTARVSVSSGGNQASGFSFQPTISSDGRYVAFESDAPDLVSPDANNANDIFVRDRQTGTTTRVSVRSDGTEANGPSYQPAISANGRYVAFYSEATNLVSGDGNGFRDIFVRDRDTDADGIFDETGAVSTTRVSVSSGGVEGNGDSADAAISSDGRYVAFYSDATNLVLGDTNGYGDVFVRDRQTSTTTRVSVDSGGNEANGSSFQPAISSDGRYVAFYSAATNLVLGDGNGSWDVFVRDRDTDADGIFDETGAVSTTRVSVDSGGNQGNANSSEPAISSDGRFVAFRSAATNLVPGDTNGADDIFVHDRQTGATGAVSVDSAGNQGNGRSSAPSISSDGRFVAFYSVASNLVPGDTNGRQDVFVHDRLTRVGGIAGLPDVASHSGRSSGDEALLAALAAAGAGVLAAGAWYARRRWVR
jgi:Tol biopolymer transport system component